MTSGIGNPDWQRRYAFSAVALENFSFSDVQNWQTGIFDSNGYTNLIIGTNSGTSVAYTVIYVVWYQDSAGNNSIGETNYVPVPGSFMAQKIPVMTRYYRIVQNYISGTTGANINYTIYGTLADSDNLLTQDTVTPILSFSSSVAVGATAVTNAAGTYGGQASVHMSGDTSNKWSGSLDYYDMNLKSWRHFHLAYGADRGQAWTQDLQLPYAPVRANMTNTDTVAQNLRVVVVGR